MMKNKIDATVNTITEEATAIFLSRLNPSGDLLPLNGDKSWLSKDYQSLPGTKNTKHIS